MGKTETAQREPAAMAQRPPEMIENAKRTADRLADTMNAQKPTKAQMAELREQLKEAPGLAAALGDLSRNIQYRIIRAIAPQPGLHIVLEARVKEIARELGAEAASPLERLLIDQVIIAWLRWQWAEVNYQHNFEGSIAISKALYLEKRLSANQRRYLQAIESLARVRRLLRRAPVQVNIAQQQIVQNG